MDLSEALTMFLHKAIAKGGLPFKQKTPNARLLEAIAETEQIIAEIEADTYNKPRYKTAAEMFAAMDAEGEEDEDYGEQI